MKKMLFLDAAATWKDPKVLIQEKKDRETTVSHYHVLEKHEKEYGQHPGDYFMIKFTDNILEKRPISIQKELEKIMRAFLKKYHKDRPILVVGLGNSNITVDSLGSSITNKMIATNHYNDFLSIPHIALINPEVTAKTGVSSYKLIKLVVSDLKPDVIIMIDSLGTKDAKSLNRVIEISDTGIIPGSALRSNKEINQSTFHIPILSIGIPLLYQSQEGLFASIHLESELEKLSSIIAESLNKILLF